MGELTKADALFAAGLATLQREGGGESPAAARFGNLYGINLILQRRYAEAETVLQKAYQAMVASNSGLLYANETLGYLATVYVRTGRTKEALQAARRSHEGYRKAVGDDNHYTAQAEALLGITELAAGATAEGIATLRSAGRNLARLLGDTHPQTQRARFHLALGLLDSRRSLAEAKAIVEALDPAQLEAASAEGDWAPRLQVLRARVLDASGERAAAVALAEPAVLELRRLAGEGGSAELQAGEALLLAGRS